MEMNSKQLVPFAFGDSLVRVFNDEQGNPWFVAKDVCGVLEISNSRDAISALDEDEKSSVGISDTSSNGVTQKRNLSIISESGLYALVFRSRKPEAKAFSKWVRSEVLPSIRKTGRYEVPRASRRDAMPEELPEAALAIPPRMRQKIWQDAIQTARLDGGGAKEATEWFDWLCRLNGFGRPAGSNVKIWNFMDEFLEEAKGFTTTFAKIRAAFDKWWCKNGQGDAPSAKTLSEYVAMRYRRVKVSVSVFRDCRICEAVNQ